MPDLFSQKNMPMASGDTYVKIVIEKSEKTKTYTRSFNKVDSFLSYIGGLIGTFISVCFIMNRYADISYSIDFSM